MAWAASTASGDATADPMKPIPSTVPAMPNSTAQMATCVKPTSATPSILPSINSSGLQLLTITSTMRLVFSSITLFIIIAPYISTKKYDSIDKATPTIMAMSVDEVSSLPPSLHLMERTFTSTLHSFRIFSRPSMP